MKNGVSRHLDFCEEFNKNVENANQKIVGTLSEKLDFVNPSAHLAGSANIDPGKFSSVTNSLQKKMKRSYFVIDLGREVSLSGIWVLL